MDGLNRSATGASKGFADCSGCGLCQLVCPVWQQQRDIRLTPHGRAKALQHGAGVADIAASLDSCTLCGACDPMCAEKIDLTGMTLDLRNALAQQRGQHSVRFRNTMAVPYSAACLLLPDAALRRDEGRLARIVALFGGDERIAVGADDGADIALALEAGTPVPERRLDSFLSSLRRCSQVVVADGLLVRQLRLWLPGSAVTGLGEALSRLDAVRSRLQADDLYVIETRAFHADHARLVGHYDRLRHDRGCLLNLDLQRMAIPATARSLPQRLGAQAIDDTAQLDWLLRGRQPRRIVAESLDDLAALGTVARQMGIPALHAADLAEAGGTC